MTELDKYMIKAVKEKRKEANVSASDLSMAIGKNIGFVNGIEAPSNKKKRYNVYHLNDIARVLGCSPRVFLPEQPLQGPPVEFSPPSRTKVDPVYLRIREMIEAQFFQETQSTKEVLNYLRENSDLDPSSTKVSMELRRLVAKGNLKTEKKGRLNLYKAKGKSNPAK